MQYWKYLNSTVYLWRSQSSRNWNLRFYSLKTSKTVANLYVWISNYSLHTHDRILVNGPRSRRVRITIHHNRPLASSSHFRFLFSLKIVFLGLFMASSTSVANIDYLHTIDHSTSQLCKLRKRRNHTTNLILADNQL